MNTNVLQGVACPKCGYETQFLIETITMALMTDDGTEETYDTQWNDDSYCECKKCNHSAAVKEFRKGQD